MQSVKDKRRSAKLRGMIAKKKKKKVKPAGPTRQPFTLPNFPVKSHDVW